MFYHYYLRTMVAHCFDTSSILGLKVLGALDWMHQTLYYIDFHPINYMDWLESIIKYQLID